MARTLNSKITPELADAMVKFFTDDCAYRERIAKSTLGVKTLEADTLRDCVIDADNATFREYGFRIRDIFVGK